MRARIIMVQMLFFTAIFSASAAGQEAEVAAKKPLAVSPEVQTAKWAVSWWMPRHKQKLLDLRKQKTVDLLMIGDSITHGWENTGKTIWASNYSKRNAFNLGFSGDRTEQVLWRLQHGEVDNISPKLAVIMIGTNNTGHRQDPPKETAAGIQAIIKELRTRLPKTKLLLLAIFPRGAEPDDKLRRINDETNKLIAEYADQRNVFYLDVSKSFLDDQGNLGKAIMPDLLHPNTKGYARWAEAMEPSIKKLMAE